MIDISNFLRHPISNSKAVFQSLSDQLNAVTPLTNGSSCFLKSLAIAKIINIQSSASADITLGNYTVPSGKRATVGLLAYNASLGTLNYIFKLTHGGKTWRLGPANAVNTNTSSQVAVFFNTYPIGEAGDQFLLNVDGAGLNIFGVILEYDTAEALKSYIIGSDGVSTTLVIGGPPSGKKAYVMNQLGSNGPIKLYNSSGATRTYNIFVVSSGNSPATTNKALAQFTLTNNNTSTQASGEIGLDTGDTIQLTTDAATNDQLIVAQNVLEF